jgi:hypothetical protein
MSLNLINKLRLIRSQCCHYFARGGVSFVYHKYTELASLNSIQISRNPINSSLITVTYIHGRNIRNLLSGKNTVYKHMHETQEWEMMGCAITT